MKTSIDFKEKFSWEKTDPVEALGTVRYALGETGEFFYNQGLKIIRNFIEKNFGNYENFHQLMISSEAEVQKQILRKINDLLRNLIFENGEQFRLTQKDLEALAEHSDSEGIFRNQTLVIYANAFLCLVEGEYYLTDESHSQNSKVTSSHSSQTIRNFSKISVRKIEELLVKHGLLRRGTNHASVIKGTPFILSNPHQKELNFSDMPRQTKAKIIALFEEHGITP